VQNVKRAVHVRTSPRVFLRLLCKGEYEYDRTFSARGIPATRVCGIWFDVDCRLLAELDEQTTKSLFLLQNRRGSDADINKEIAHCRHERSPPRQYAGGISGRKLPMQQSTKSTKRSSCNSPRRVSQLHASLVGIESTASVEDTT
jgi:hypothetical protein